MHSIRIKFQNNSNNENELRSKKEIIWINSLTYRPRLKKNFVKNPRSEHQERHNLESAPKFIPHPRSTVYSKSADPLDLAQEFTICAIFNAKSIYSKTYSPPPPAPLYFSKPVWSPKTNRNSYNLSWDNYDILYAVQKTMRTCSVHGQMIYKMVMQPNFINKQQPCLVFKKKTWRIFP